jgi:D-xylonolactonase
MDYEKLTSFSCLLGECPIWDEETARLWWTDIHAAVVYTYSPSTGKLEPRIRGKNVGGFALTRDEGVLCACLDGLFLWKPATGFNCIASSFKNRPLRFNDCTTDPCGRFLAGTRYPPEVDGGTYELGCLYRVDNDGSMQILERDVHLSNGLGFSPDDSILYYTDSLKRIIYRYDYDLQTGNVSNRRIFARIPEEDGIPDGLTVDSQGFVWSARWDDDYIVRYDPEGTIERSLPSPERKTTSLMFGGGDLTDLYLTTAADSGRTGDRGGFLYRTHLEIPGRIEHRAEIREKERR